jgi:hypothetical protein
MIIPIAAKIGTAWRQLLSIVTGNACERFNQESLI